MTQRTVHVFSVTPFQGSVCRRQFSHIMMDVVGVKSLVEHDLKVRSLKKCTFLEIFLFIICMYM